MNTIKEQILKSDMAEIKTLNGFIQKIKEISRFRKETVVNNWGRTYTCCQQIKLSIFFPNLQP